MILVLQEKEILEKAIIYREFLHEYRHTRA
jgi:hypothetical protein